MSACAALALAALLLAAPAAAAELEDFEGEWFRAEVARDDAAMHAEIERVTESMPILFRGFARGVMRRRMAPSERYVIETGSEPPVIRSANGIEYRIDGETRAGGESEAVTSRFHPAGEIHQSWNHGESSHGTTVWRLEADGARLLVSERVHDSHFDEAMEYSNAYRRVDASP